MILTIPNYLKPLGWLLWKLNIAIRLPFSFSHIIIKSGKRILERGKDYKISKEGLLTMIIPTDDIKIERKVLACKYYIKLFE